MNTENKLLQKRTYSTPNIECVKLDNEISLALESTPPTGPFESNNTNAPEYFNNDPFKGNVG
jgi:hypothetical protein